MRMIHKNNQEHKGNYFKKRTYAFNTFFKDLINIARKRKQISSSKISRKFSEHIMLVVTSVNGCVYCEWGHVNWAKQEGSTEEEIAGLLSLNFGDLPPEEVIALSFAQHYAETLGHPSPDAVHRLIQEYGKEKGQSIISSCDMITIGNLLGNTISAFLSRLQGIPPENGSLFFELLVYIFGGFWMDHMMRKSNFSSSSS
jgi:AhpD family alkylhydroperoxidase